MLISVMRERRGGLVLTILSSGSTTALPNDVPASGMGAVKGTRTGLMMKWSVEKCVSTEFAQ
jgi:hypothetical protein